MGPSLEWGKGGKDNIKKKKRTKKKNEKEEAIQRIMRDGS